MLRWLALVFLGLVVLLRGWLSDDAFIGFRSVDHLVAGRGLVFNVGERVQSFTNPLWVLLLAIPHWLFRDPYAVMLVSGVLVTLAGAWLLGWHLVKSPLVGGLALGLLALCESFGDFATSGLENPLSHLLLLGVLLFAFDCVDAAPGVRLGKLTLPWLCAGLALTTRLDNAVILSFCLIDLALRQFARLSKAGCGRGARSRAPLPHRRLLSAIALGLLPLIAWELFALVYYGSFVPNTAVAKLGVELPRSQVLGQGVTYLLTSVERDPLTPLLIGAGVIVGLRARRTLPLACGILAHLAYVVWVGGDFMAGRFLSLPLVAAVALLAWRFGSSASPIERATKSGVSSVPLPASLGILGAALLVAVLSPYRPFAPGGERVVPPTGIVSERDFYRPELGIVPNLRRRAYKEHGFWRDGVRFREGSERVVVHDNAGLTAYAAGPERHLVDTAGLTDPLLARVPVSGAKPWRVGHYTREIPAGYLESLRTDRNRLTDPRYRALYERLRLVTRGRLFDRERLRAIYELQVGSLSTAKNASP